MSWRCLGASGECLGGVLGASVGKKASWRRLGVVLEASLRLVCRCQGGKRVAKFRASAVTVPRPGGKGGNTYIILV